VAIFFTCALSRQSQARLYIEIQEDAPSVDLWTENVDDHLKHLVWVENLGNYGEDSVFDLPQVKQVIHECLHQHDLAQDQFEVLARQCFVAARRVVGEEVLNLFDEEKNGTKRGA